MKSRTLGILAVTAFSRLTNAQVVGPAIMAHTPNSPQTRACVETAIIASGADVLVAYRDVAGFVHYSISTNGLSSAVPWAVSDGLLAGSDCNGTSLIKGTDPMVARTASGDLFVGGIFQYLASPISNFAVSARRKAPGATTLDAPFALACHSLEIGNDKPLIAIGPRPGGAAGERLYATYAEVAQPGCNSFNSRSASALLSSLSTVDNTPIGSGPSCGEAGNGCMPVVLPSGIRTGRVIVAFTPGPTDGMLPKLWRSDTEGVPSSGMPGWSETAAPTQARTPGVVPLETLFDFAGTAVPGNFRVQNFPALAVDPANSTVVYLVFAAATASTGTSNIDVVISQSLDSGETFDSIRTLHLTDALLGLPAGTDQIMPWIAVDVLGGVNLLFYSVAENPNTDMENVPFLRAYYARLPAFNPSSPPTPFVYPLSPNFLVPVTPGASWPNGSQVTGDYQMICADGCVAYVAYMSAEAGAGDVYVRKISGLCAVADSDQDGAITTNDPPTFAMQYAQGDPRADLTNNGTIDGQDVQRFIESYACGCNP